MADLIRYREGSVTVTVDGEVARWVDAVLRSAGRDVLGAIEVEVNNVHRVAVDRWPVRSGRSRDGLRTALTLDRTRGRIEGAVLALVPYSIYVKSYKGGLQGKSAWQVLVRGPMNLAKKRLTASLGDVIVNGGKRRAR